MHHPAGGERDSVEVIAPRPDEVRVFEGYRFDAGGQGFPVKRRRDRKRCPLAHPAAGEIAVAPGTVVAIAHDDRAPLPAWLTRQFTPTPRTLTADGVVMRLFERAMGEGGSLTFGSNTDGAPVSANHYIVFVSGR